MARVRTMTAGLLLLVLAGSAAAQQANQAAVARRPFYEITDLVLDPARRAARGTLLIQWFNGTGRVVDRLAFSFPGYDGEVNSVPRVRVNHTGRGVEVIPRSRAEGDSWDGFEVVASRRTMPPDAVSRIEIDFRSRLAEEVAGLTVYQGDWFPRILGPADREVDPFPRAFADYDVTVYYPLDLRGALSGRILREDASGSNVELYNGAVEVTNYGVALSDDLFIVEGDVYGVQLRLFHRAGDDARLARLMADVRHVLEYIKRSTPFRPPMILNVVPGDSTLEGARPLFANTLLVHAGGSVGTAGSRVRIATALHELYWGFGGTDRPEEMVTPLERALALYGTLLYARTRGVDTSWVHGWENHRDAGLIADHHRALAAPLFAGEQQEGFREQAAEFSLRRSTGAAFTGLLSLEAVLGGDLLERACWQLFARKRKELITSSLLREAVEKVAGRELPEAHFRFDRVERAAVVRSENRGLRVGRWVTRVDVVHTGGAGAPLPLRMITVNGDAVDGEVAAGADSVVFRHPSAPAEIVLDPEHTRPLLQHALANGPAAVLVAHRLEAQARYAEAAALLEAVRAQGGSVTPDLAAALARSWLATGRYRSAVELLDGALEEKLRGDDRAQLLLLLGKASDLMGRREQAKSRYHEAARYGAAYQAAAQALLETPYTQ